MPIGAPEVIIVLVIALIILGPKKLPQLGRSLGSGMREFKESIGGGAKHDDDPAELASASDEPTAKPAAAATRPAEPVPAATKPAPAATKPAPAADAPAATKAAPAADAPADEPASIAPQDAK